MELPVRCPNPDCGRYLRLDAGQLGEPGACPGCRRTFRPLAPFGPVEMDRTIRYQLVEKLGQGGMGEVFRAKDFRLGREVALKVPRQRGDWDHETIDRFRLEVEAVKRLSHDNLCAVIDHDVKHEPPYLTMEYMPGGSLDDWSRARPRPDLREALVLVRTLALGLEHAHRHGVVHRDLKLANVLFDEKGRPRVTDFGLALLTETPPSERISEPNQILGTLLYMSPEQLRGPQEAVERATDVYALGVLMFRLLCGSFPYRCAIDNRNALVQEIRQGLTVSPAERRGDLDGRVDALFATATAPDPARRFRSMEAFHDAIGEILGIAPSSASLRIEHIESRPKSPSVPSAIVSRTGLELAPIPTGAFVMGSSDQLFALERPTRRVVLRAPFLLGVYPVTQRQYRALLGNAVKPFFTGFDTAPMESVTWLDAVHFCNALSEEEGLDAYYKIAGDRVIVLGGAGFRLPTEAEWEYACRAGSAAAYWFGDDDAALRDHAWFEANAEGSVHEVGRFAPNGFGLHDMHGNVWEWCWDWYAPYKPGRAIDPAGPARGKKRVLRGGSWQDTARSLRCAARAEWEPDDKTWAAWNFGFRVARTA